MTENRKIIGVFDLPMKKDVAFPSVRVWLDGPAGHEVRGLRQSFPHRGTVFLHISACEGQQPIRNQVGLFTCVPPSGGKAEWKVINTSRHLANVVVCSTWERNPQELAFWEWLNAYKDGASCNVLLGDGTLFVRRGKHEVVGPFQFRPDGGINARRLIQRFGEVEIVKIDVGGKPCEFIDAESLSRGRPLIIDPREAIHRRLKLVHDESHLDWLSRSKLQELSAALAQVTVSDGSEWVMESLPHTLQAISAPGHLDEKLSEAILQIKGVSEAIEAVWRKKHSETVKKAEEEIDGLKKTATGVRQTLEALNGELARLQNDKNSLEGELQELIKNIEAAKADAGKVFDAELKRLAASPASMALFATWSSSSSRATGTNSDPRIKIERRHTAHGKAGSLFDAIVNNLKITGLSPISAAEVATVCGAALLTGQPISFRSIFSDSLADAVISALGQPMALWADVPAGLLDPIDWDSLIADNQKVCPIILQGANRSDISLVLGSKRLVVLQQVLGYKKPDGLLFMTLEPSKEMRVESDLDLGALIDEPMLKFASAKGASTILAANEYSINVDEIALITDEEFDELVGDDFKRLPLFATSARRMVYRRAISGLRLSEKSSEEIERLFFKYWVLPRLTSSDVIRVLEAHKEKWKRDKVLNELTQALTNNE